MSKTSTPEVLCDWCHNTIPLGTPTAIFVTLRGLNVGHMKRDFCSATCLRDWAVCNAGNLDIPEPRRPK